MPRGIYTRHCKKCELPKQICACAEAEAYDKANHFVEVHSCSFSTSRLTGSSGGIAYYTCNDCGEEWDKDVS